MLKNVHLAPGWLMQLEKKLHSLQPHACFRLFLTMEINPKVGGRARRWVPCRLDALLRSGGVAPSRSAQARGSDGRLSPQVPVNLLRAGRIFVFEPPPGVKANMLRTFSSIPVSRICKVRPALRGGPRRRTAGGASFPRGRKARACGFGAGL